MKRALVCLLLLPAMAGCASEPLPDLGPAPAYETALRDGSAIALADLQGEVVVLNLWATWCGPCKHEMPLIEELYQEFRAEGLRVLAVSMDDFPDSEERIDAFVNEAGLTYDIAWDKGGDAFVPAFFPHGSLGTPPETYLIGRDGHIVAFWAGAFDPNEAKNRDLVERALAA